MAFEIDISHNIKEVQKSLNQIEKKVIKRATARALNKTGTTVNAEAARRISRATGFKVAQVKNELRIFKAHQGRLAWTLRPSKRQTNLIEFIPPGKRYPGAFRKQAGVRSKAWGKQKTYPGTFIGRGKNSGKALVFKRDPRKNPNAKRSNLSVVYGPSVIGQFLKEIQGLSSFASKRFENVFRQQMDFELSKVRNK